LNIIEGLPPKRAYKRVAIDLELFGLFQRQLHRPHGEFALLSIATNTDTVYLIDRAEDVAEALARVDEAEWVFHNAAFDVTHLRRWADIPPREKFRDTMLLDRILWSGWYENFKLSDLYRRYFHKVLEKDERESFEGEPRPITKAMKRYAALDAAATFRIAQRQERFLSEDPASWRVWQEIDAPALWAILDFKGFKVDYRRWQKMAAAYQKKANAILKRLGFNPGSPQQVVAALAKQGIHVDSTREAELSQHAGNAVVDAILEYRDAKKRASTYGESMLEDFVEPDDRIYASFLVIGAETGRMSSRSPNLQNIPRDEEFRACFVPAPGNRLIIADVSQQEPRITAILSQDPELYDAFNAGEDIHLAVARAIFHNPNLTKADKHERNIGKKINLASTYGLSAYGLSNQTGLPVEEAQHLLTQYFARFRGVARWMNETRRLGESQGFVRTLGGRRVWLNLYARWQNSAINAPVQGSAAEMIKLTLKRLHRYYGSALPIVAVVHDEIVVEVPAADVAAVSKRIQKAMEEAFLELHPTAPIHKCADVHVGLSWAAKK
jgi:DNA polymerase I